MNEPATQAPFAGADQVSRDAESQAQRRTLLLGTLKAAAYMAPATLALITMQARAGS